jgi:IclR family transcriptional regulator, acetate operon repressor
VTELEVAPRSGVTGTQAVDRACLLVSLVVRADEPLTFTEITDATGLARSTTSRLLAALERTDLLKRDASGAYVAGGLFTLHSARRDRWDELARVAEPFLQHLGDRTGETALLGVPRGRTVSHVSQIDSTYLLAARDWRQVEVPVHCSAMGKALCAAGVLPLPDEPLERRTAHSRPDLEALLRDLDEARARGFAVAVDELEVGLTAVATPVCGRDGEVVAALGVTGATARLRERKDEVGRLLVEQADALSALLRRSRNREGAA